MAIDTTIVREAPFLEAGRQKLIESVQGLAEIPVTLPTQQLAPFSQATTDAFTQAQTGLGAFQPFLASAGQQLGSSQALTDALAARATTTGPQRLDEARTAALAGAGDITPRIAAFQNPFQQQVIDAFTQEAERQGAIARNRASDQAVRAGAFGGSGAALQQAELERNLADVQQRNIANLLSQGYTQSLGAAEREAARIQQLPQQLTGIEALQTQLPLGVASQQQNLSQLYGGLGQLAQQLPAQDTALLSQIGAQQQQQAQRALDIGRQNILQQTYEPYQRLGFVGDILRGQPSVQSTLTQSTDPRANPLSQILGAGISLGGIFGPQGFGSGFLFQNPNLSGATLQAARGA
jgi:hypothetical protein